MELDSISCASAQSKTNADEVSLESEIRITQASVTASATSKHCRGYREPDDAALTSQGLMSQIPAVRKASPKSLSPTNGNSMFLDEVEIEPQIQFSSLKRESTRMVRSPKAELLFQIAKNSRGFKKSADTSFVKSQELLNRFPAARMATFSKPLYKKWLLVVENSIFKKFFKMRL